MKIEKKSFTLTIILVLTLLPVIVNADNCGGAVQCRCGDTVIESHTMWYDLDNCPDHGLIIGADNIVLDCASHLIDSDAGISVDYGIKLYNKQGVEIRNCNLTHFNSGIQLYYGLNNVLFNNKVSINFPYGIDGIVLDHSSNNILQGNILNNNNHGIILSHSNYNRILDNTANNNRYEGIFLIDQSDNNVVFRNIVNNNFDTGIRIGNSLYNIVHNNIVNDNHAFGVYLFENANNNHIVDNTANRNEYGIYINSASINYIISNNLNNNDFGIKLVSSSNNLLSNNTVNNSLFHAFYLESGSNNNIIWNNNANNSGYGFYLVSCSRNFLSANTANNNYYGLGLSHSANNAMSSNIFSGCYYGVNYIYSRYNILWRNIFTNNSINAYEDESSNDNNWNIGPTGNYWDDFNSNIGYPTHYEIDGPGNGIDWHPIRTWNDFWVNLTLEGAIDFKSIGLKMNYKIVPPNN